MNVKMSEVHAKRSTSFSIDSLMAIGEDEGHHLSSSAVDASALVMTSSSSSIHDPLKRTPSQPPSIPGLRDPSSSSSLSLLTGDLSSSPSNGSVFLCRSSVSPIHRHQQRSSSLSVGLVAAGDGLRSNEQQRSRGQHPIETRYRYDAAATAAHNSKVISAHDRIFSEEDAPLPPPPTIRRHSQLDAATVGQPSSVFFPLPGLSSTDVPRSRFLQLGSPCSGRLSSVLTPGASGVYNATMDSRPSQQVMTFGNDGGRGGGGGAAFPLYSWLLSRPYFDQRFHSDIVAAEAAAAAGLFYPFRKPKRIRTAFSPSQLIQLEDAFNRNHYVVGQERKDLAAALNLTEIQVKVWFQNRRTKHKRVQPEFRDDGHSADNDNLRQVLSSDDDDHDDACSDDDDDDGYVDVEKSDYKTLQEVSDFNCLTNSNDNHHHLNNESDQNRNSNQDNSATKLINDVR